nr:immunoglobulin light chain junction region [Macaca mulatta]
DYYCCSYTNSNTFVF